MNYYSLQKTFPHLKKKKKNIRESKENNLFYFEK
jgi:hypothetical protein